MKALTLWQPWAWAIAHAGKRIENREWKPPVWIIGEQIAIHAGKTLDEHAAADLLEDLEIEPGTIEFSRGAVVAIATVKGWVSRIAYDHPQARWFGGPCGWVLIDVVPLAKPVPCRGRQKLWDLPADVEAEVRRQAA